MERGQTISNPISNPCYAPRMSASFVQRRMPMRDDGQETKESL